MGPELCPRCSLQEQRSSVLRVSRASSLDGPHWMEGWIDMAEGTIKRLTDKGFGFIETSPGKDIFFHMSAVEGVRFEDLKQGQRVSFTEGQGPKGPRAENVKLI